MQPHDLFETADILLSSAKGRPTIASLCRATSASYYALFHFLAQDCANLLIGHNRASRSQDAWQQVYRSLDHGFAKDKMRKKTAMGKFPIGIIDFADTFMVMQEKRHAADYDPFFKITKSQVRADVALCRQAIQKRLDCSLKDRRAFCAYVLLKDRPK